MKQSHLVASVLVGGALAGIASVLAFQALKPAPMVAANSSAPQAQVATATVAATASAPASLAAATTALPVNTPSAVAPQPAPVPAPAPAPVYARSAKILSVTPIKETVTAAKQVCHQEQYQQQAPVQDNSRVTGSVIGGLLGGVLGHQVGGGNGKTAATVVGALAGGYAGNKTQENMQQRDQTIATRTICSDQEVPVSKTVGYNVRYSLDGQIGTVRRDHRPKGKTLPASNGKLL